MPSMRYLILRRREAPSRRTHDFSCSLQTPIHSQALEVAPPERLAFTEIWDEDWTGGEVLVTLAFAEHDGTTMMRQTMLYSSRDARDAGLATEMEQGMALSYDRLAKLLA